MFSRCVHNIVNFGSLAAKIHLPVCGTPANFNGFRDLAVLLHGSQVCVSVSQTLRHWTEGATYVRQGDYHVGHWPTFSFFFSFFFSSPNLSRRRLDVCHTSTHGVTLVRCANLRCRSETCCTRFAGNAGPKKVAKSPSRHHRTTLLGYIFTNKARINNRKKNC